MSTVEELSVIQKSRTLMLHHNTREKEVCRQLYICETSLRTIFNKYFGMPPHQYMANIWMRKAKTLLRTTDLRIVEIAEQLNYTSSSKFSIAFKRHYGCTPCEYRRSVA